MVTFVSADVAFWLRSHHPMCTLNYVGIIVPNGRTRWWRRKRRAEVLWQLAFSDQQSAMSSARRFSLFDSSGS